MSVAGTWRDNCAHNPECPTESSCNALDAAVATVNARFGKTRFPQDMLSVLTQLVGELNRQALALRGAAAELLALNPCNPLARARGESLAAEAVALERRAAAVAVAIARLDP